MQQSEQCYIFKYQSDYNSQRNALARVARKGGGGGHNAFRSLSVHLEICQYMHVSRQACNLYQQNIEKIAVL